jgi:hypothetical protein
LKWQNYYKTNESKISKKEKVKEEATLHEDNEWGICLEESSEPIPIPQVK